MGGSAHTERLEYRAHLESPSSFARATTGALVRGVVFFGSPEGSMTPWTTRAKTKTTGSSWGGGGRRRLWSQEYQGHLRKVQTHAGANAAVDHVYVRLLCVCI